MLAFPPLEERRLISGSIVAVAFMPVAMFLSLPAYRFRALAFVAVVPLILACIPFYTTGAVATDYLISSATLCWLLMGGDFLVLSDPERDFWRVEGTREGEKTRWKDMGWSWEKLKWGLDLLSSSRGIGWSWEVKNVPPKPPVGYPVRKHILNHLLRFLVLFVLIDAVEIYKAAVLYSHNAPAHFYALPPWNQFLLAWAGWIAGHCSISICFSFAAVLLMTLGIYGPRDFPPAFGRFRDSWSVRQFWGATWHQYLRRMLSTYGRCISRALGFDKGTNASSYTQLYIAFLLSGIIHEFGAFCAARQSMGELRFFLSQAVAITFEDMVIAAAKKLGCRDGGWAGRVVGYLWVICWLGYSLRGWTNGQILGGMWDGEQSVSVVRKGLELAGVEL